MEEVGGRGNEEGTPTCATASKTVTGTVVGEHVHTIAGYSLVRGLGDGEPVASERFSVGGHEWVLLFYPDGKRSAADIGNHIHPHSSILARAGLHGSYLPIAPGGEALGGHRNSAQQPREDAEEREGNVPNSQPMQGSELIGRQAEAVVQGMPFTEAARLPWRGEHMPSSGRAAVPIMSMGNLSHGNERRDATGEYCALFVALIGEGKNPQGVVHTSEGRIVRAFHRFTLVDQSGQENHITKGRRREQGAVKISCARSDPNARNCHGYRKFVRRSVLENPQYGYLHDDQIVIRYTIELVVTEGGALTRREAAKLTLPDQLPSSLGKDLTRLLESGQDADVTFHVGNETFPAHRLVLMARSPVLSAMLSSPMKEGEEGVVRVMDVEPFVFRSLLYFIYADDVPELEGEDGMKNVPLIQHLLAAADRFGLERLRRTCERKLCEAMEVETAATTLALAEQSHAVELKRIALTYVAENLARVMGTDGWEHMVQACPGIMPQVLEAVAQATSHSPNEDRPGGMDEMNAPDDPSAPGNARDRNSPSFSRRVRFRRM
eukprot:scaffold308_cov327-Pavlova_lutheri.AAC.7